MSVEQDQAYRRAEASSIRFDRQWSELLQELRVMQTGVQVLTGFLLTIPFQQRFTTLNRVERGHYIAAAVLAVVSTLFLIAPVAMHRLLFRRHVRDRLVARGQ